MKDIYKIITAVLFVAWLLVVWKLPAIVSFKDTGLATEEDVPAPALSAADGQAAQSGEGNPYLGITERLKSPFPISRYNELIARNIFVKPEKPQIIFSPDSLRLISVETIPLPFTYNGFIQTPAGQ